MRVIVDVMGGDNAPGEILKGVFSASCKTESEFVLVGRRKNILQHMKDTGIKPNRYEIVDAEDVVTMEDEPMVALHKKNSSMMVALRLLSDGKGDVLVSAGNTGALFSGASLIVKRAKGVERAAIGTLLPGRKPCLLLDAGANVTVTEKYLEQFAEIGSDYMRKQYGIESPKVGMLNNGTEDCKGTPLQIEASKRLRGNSGVNFIGNVEASAVMTGICDVALCDGFTGNIFLKASEGMGKMMLSSLKDIYTESLLSKFHTS